MAEKSSDTTRGDDDNIVIISAIHLRLSQHIILCTFLEKNYICLKLESRRLV